MTADPLPDLSFLHRLADAADAVTLKAFRTPMAVEAKAHSLGMFDPVTAADRGAEQAMRARIRAQYPDHGIAGEEEADERPGAACVWHLDPIDGTRQFIAGMPLWTTLIGFAVAGVPRLGLVSQPFTGERFEAGPQGSFLVDRAGRHRLATRTCPELAAATLFTTGPQLYRGAAAEARVRLEHAVRLVRYGADAYAFALLALGFVDIVIETGLDDHDVVALVPLIEGAGGRVVDWQGRPARGGGDVLAVGDPRLAEAALACLGG